jgi:cytochrome P450
MAVTAAATGCPFDHQQMPIPAHVPPSAVYDYDYLSSLSDSGSHAECARALRDNAGEIFWTPRNGGHWIVQGAELSVRMLRDTELFSSHPDYNKTRRFATMLLPSQVDPPAHTDYRRALSPVFSPGNMRKIEPDIRAIATGLIDKIQPRGKCEFVSEFAEYFPIAIFLSLVGAPMSDRDELLRYAGNYTRSSNREIRSVATEDLARYIRGLSERRGANAADNMLTQVAKLGAQGRDLTQEELDGLGVQLFVAGLDTVKSAISFIMLHLARNPDHYARLVADPELIPAGIEELLRISGPSNPERGVTRDLEDYAGVALKKDDRIVFILPLAGFDPKLNEDSYTVDFDREASQHLVFGAGIHRCAGSHLARIEVRVLLEEWTKRFPTFRVDPDDSPEITKGGTVWTAARVPLAWP